jgi:hypothetical protein
MRFGITSDFNAAELRPGMKCLLNVLNGQSFDWQVEDAEWESALALANKDRVLPWFLSRVDEATPIVTSHIEALLNRARRENAIEAFFWRGELKGLLKAFHEEALPVVPLKGPALAERIYGGMTMRTCQDLDILVHGHDFAQAQTLLAQLGFVPKEITGYQQGWVRGAMMVELHRDVSDPCLFDFHIEGAWRRASPMTFEGIPAGQFSPEDEFLFLCLHAVRHEFNRLSVVLDIALASHLLAGSTESHLRPEVKRLRRHGELGYLIAHQLLPQLCAKVPLLEEPKVVRGLRPLASDRVRNVLTRTDTYLSWPERQRFYMQLETPGRYRFRRRWSNLWQMVRHMLAADLAERDFAFAGRWGLTRPWQVRVLRPFRLAGSARWLQSRSSKPR